MPDQHDACEVLVVGGGLAGWTAATRALELGRTTMLVERSPVSPGWGNTLISGGALHAVLQDPRTAPDELVAKITSLTDGHADPVVARAWADGAAPTISWMEAHGAPFMSDPDHPHRACVFSPVRPTVPGLHYEGFGALQFLTMLSTAFVAAGGVVNYGARATELERVGGHWNVLVSGAHGRRVVTARAVVLCDGGFQANPVLMRQFVGTDKVRLRAVDTATGDGLQMGLAVGGVAVNMDSFYGHVLVREALDSDDLWPYPILDGLAAQGIVVGPRGNRFVDETISGVTTANHLAWSEDPLGNWLVIDDTVWQGPARYGSPSPNPYLAERGATVLTAPTIEDLARQAGIDPAGLVGSVANLHSPAPESPDPPPSGTMRSATAPFHAIPVIAGVTFTMGGLRVDGSARVLSADGAPIPGLYAAGGTMGGLHGGPNAGYAGGLLEAAVFGLLAGGHAGGALPVDPQATV